MPGNMISLSVLADRLAAEANPLWEYVPEPLRNVQMRIRAAIREYEARDGRPRILVIQGSDRNENTCPQEPPKSLRLCQRAVELIEADGCDAELLDLSRITSEKRMIWPCKGCFSTSAALCHVGCSCYPNESLGQVNDWMNEEIYEMLVRSHGIMVVTPTYWYSMPSCLKLLIDRMVCLDGSNWDPTTTLVPPSPEHPGKYGGVKNVEKAKELERGPQEGGESQWDYIGGKVLAGRVFNVFVHGDAAGVDLVLEAVTETLRWFGMVEAPQSSSGYIGYMETYADSHTHLDEDDDSWAQLEVQVEALTDAVKRAYEAGMPIPPMVSNIYQK